MARLWAIVLAANLAGASFATLFCTFTPLFSERIRLIALAIFSEMALETAGGRLLVETWALALAARLAHSYAEPEPIRPQRFRSHRLDQIRLRRVLDYIAQHLDENITVAVLAGVACLSPFHVARMFSAAMGVPPHRYVSQQRLESPMALLAAGKQSLGDATGWLTDHRLHAKPMTPAC